MKMDKGLCECCFIATEKCLADEAGSLLSLCFSIQVFGNFSNEFPIHICNECLRKLKDCNNFRLQILETQFKLQTIRKSIKIEPIDARFEPEIMIAEEPMVHFENYINADGSFMRNQNNINNSDTDIDNGFYFVKSENVDIDLKSEDGKEISSNLVDFTNINNLNARNQTHLKNEETYIRIDLNESKLGKNQMDNVEKNVIVFQTREIKNEIGMAPKDVDLISVKTPDKYGDKSGLIEQVATIRTSSIQHMCNKCNQTYPTKIGLKLHLKLCGDHVNKIAFVNVDSSMSVLPIQSEENVTTHQPENFKCTVCGKCFKHEKSFKTHMRRFHSNLQMAIECQLCTVRCEDQSAYSDHMNHHHYSKSDFVCSACNQSFTRKYHLVRHLEQTGCDGRKKAELLCKICGKTFARKDNLREHLKQHDNNGILERLHACDYCDKKFKGKSSLINHIKIHTGLSLFACSYCPKSMKSKGSLIKHIRSHTGEKPFSCKKCGKSFAAQEVLNRHVKTHLKIKPIKCDECGETFIQASQLRTHMFYHNNENGLKCEQCDKFFSNKSNLRTHQKFEHEGVKRLKCSYDACTITFSTIQNRKKHEKTQHFATSSCAVKTEES